jgi:hypothetical protein
LLQQGPLACFAFFWWIHQVHKHLGGSPEVLQLDMLKVVGELLFSISDYLLQPLNVISMAIQHILHVSKQLFFIC